VVLTFAWSKIEMFGGIEKGKVVSVLYFGISKVKKCDFVLKL